MQVLFSNKADVNLIWGWESGFLSRCNLKLIPNKANGEFNCPWDGNYTTLDIEGRQNYYFKSLWVKSEKLLHIQVKLFSSKFFNQKLFHGLKFVNFEWLFLAGKPLHKAHPKIFWREVRNMLHKDVPESRDKTWNAVERRARYIKRYPHSLIVHQTCVAELEQNQVRNVKQVI